MMNARVCYLAGLGLGAALLVLAPGACAQPAPPMPPAAAPVLSPEAQREWERLREEGKKASHANQWSTARDLYLQAWRTKQDWRVAANLGRAEFEAGKFADAAEHLTYFAREAPATLAQQAPDEWKKAQDMLEKARAKVGRLRITVDPPEADVLVNGQVVGRAPLPGVVFVDPGPVFVEARLEGYTAQRVSRTTVAGQEEGVSLLLRKGAALGPIPMRDDHVEGRKLNKTVLITGIVATVVLAGVGIGFGAASIAETRSYDREILGLMCKPAPTPCPYSNQENWLSYNERALKRGTYAWVGTGALIGAGALGGATLIYGLTRSNSSAKAAIFVSPASAGVAAMATW